MFCGDLAGMSVSHSVAAEGLGSRFFWVSGLGLFGLKVGFMMFPRSERRRLEVLVCAWSPVAKPEILDPKKREAVRTMGISKPCPS